MPNMAGMLQLARPGPARIGSDRSGIVWCPLCGTYACNYFYKFIHIVPFMALPVAGLRSKQRAAALLTCSFPGPTCLLSLTLSLSAFLFKHFVAHTSLSLAMTRHGQNCMLIASSQLQTKPHRFEARPRPTSFKYPLKSEIYALALCKRRLRITARLILRARARARARHRARVQSRPGRQISISKLAKYFEGFSADRTWWVSYLSL